MVKKSNRRKRAGRYARALPPSPPPPTTTTTNNQHPTPNTQHPTPNTQHPTPNTQHPTPNTQHPTPDTRHPTPDTRQLVRPAAQQLLGKVGLLHTAAATGAEQRAASAAATAQCEMSGRAGLSTRSAPPGTPTGHICRSSLHLPRPQHELLWHKEAGALFASGLPFLVSINDVPEAWALYSRASTMTRLCSKHKNCQDCQARTRPQSDFGMERGCWFRFSKPFAHFSAPKRVVTKR